MPPEFSSIEHSVIAEGASLAADHKHRRKHPECANCGFTFAEEPANADNFCPRCGQENHELNVPFKHLVLEFLEGTLHFDSKFFRSVKYLLFRPGFLSAEFNVGHRAGYVPPIRLYVFTSFLFFLLLSWQAAKSTADIANISDSATDKTQVTADSAAKKTSGFSISKQRKKPVEINIDGQTLSDIDHLKTDEQLDSFMRASKVEPTFINKLALKQAARIKQGGTDKFMNKLIKNISMLMFVLMPLFALLVGLAYRSRKRHYVEFLMFSLHFHTFLFVVFGLYLLLPDAIDSSLVDSVVLLLPIVYLGLALRQVYPERWGKVVGKTVVLSMVYNLVLVLFLLSTMMVSFAFF